MRQGVRTETDKRFGVPFFATLLAVTEGRPLGGSLRRAVRGEQASQHNRTGQFHF